ncbi:MAG: hypothetical protein JRJ14_09325 [Deltaproteobacteria bacterium]|nr:hypothetical protein [Deltaproteobacteria bacterium]
MRKVTCLVMVCLLVSVLALASGALAISKKKILNTEWEVTGSAKFYHPVTGDYLGSMVGGIGIAIIGEKDIVGTFAPMVISGLTGLGEATVIAGATAIWTMDDWTKDGDVLRAITGSVVITPPGGGEPIVDYEGDMTVKITFLTETTLKGKIKYTGDDGVQNVVKLTGKLLGQLPDAEPEPQ